MIALVYGHLVMWLHVLPVILIQFILFVCGMLFYKLNISLTFIRF
jgi:hypothetical protein